MTTKKEKEKDPKAAIGAAQGAGLKNASSEPGRTVDTDDEFDDFDDEDVEDNQIKKQQLSDGSKDLMDETLKDQRLKTSNKDSQAMLEQALEDKKRTEQALLELSKRMDELSRMVANSNPAGYDASMALVDDILEEPQWFYFYGTRFALTAYVKGGREYRAPGDPVKPIVFDTLQRTHMAVGRGVETFCLCGFKATTKAQKDFIEGYPGFGITVFKKQEGIEQINMKDATDRMNVASNVGKMTDNEVLGKVRAIESLRNVFGSSMDVVRMKYTTYLLDKTKKQFQTIEENVGQTIGMKYESKLSAMENAPA